MVSGRFGKIAVTAIAAGGAFLAVGSSSALADDTCLDQVPTIVGTPGDDSGVDKIVGTPGNDVILGLGGNDEIDGGGGTRDFICGGAGEDTIVTLDGDDVVGGQDGDDDITTGAGDDYVDGGSGTDACDAGGDAQDYVVGCTNPTEYIAGVRAPDLVARTAFDNKFRLSDLEGQNVLLDFSSIWCPPSTRMARDVAGVQETLRNAGVPFTYVLAEVQGRIAGVPSSREDAEIMTEKFGLYDSPVLHAQESRFSLMSRQSDEYGSENGEYQPNGSNHAYPTLVFINRRGKITEVHIGALEASDILDRYGDFDDPADGPISPTPLPGVDVENLRNDIGELGLPSKSFRSLKKTLTGALRSLEYRVRPDRSPCSYLQDFKRGVKKTKGLSRGDKASLRSRASSIAAKIGCG